MSRLREPLLIAIASRFYAVLVLLVATALNLPSGAGTVFASPFVMWDAEWYLSIARTGYHAASIASTHSGLGYHDFAFFPVWPVFLRIASLNGALSLEIVAPVAANLLFIAAAVPIYRAMEQIGGTTGARFGLLLFAFSPAAYVYSLAYSEPLFLLTTSALLVTDRPRVAAALGGVAQLTRLSGAAVAAAALADLLRAETRRRGIFLILTVIAAFAVWWIAIAVLTGDPFGYMRGSPAWYSSHPTLTQTGVAGLLEQPTGITVVSFAFLLVLLAGLIRVFQSGQLRMFLFAATCLGSALLVRPDSMPRLAAVAFPAFAGVALLLPSDRTRWLVFGIFGVTEAVLGALAAAGFITP